MELSNEQYNLILTSLNFTKQQFENYQNYPSYEFKRQKIDEVEKTMDAVREAKKACNN